MKIIDQHINSKEGYIWELLYTNNDNDESLSCSKNRYGSCMKDHKYRVARTNMVIGGQGALVYKSFYKAADDFLKIKHEKDFSLIDFMKEIKWSNNL